MTLLVRAAIGGVLALAAVAPLACRRPQIVPAPPVVGFATGEPVTITLRAPAIAPPPVPPVVRRQLAILTPVARTRLTPGNVPRGSRLRFELFEDLVVTAVVEYVEIYGDTGVTLVATGQSHPGHVALSYEAGRLAVSFALPTEGDIEIVPFSAQELLVNQMAKQLLVSCEATGRVRRGSRTPASSGVARGAVSQIDVGVMYTRAALCSLRPTKQCLEEEALRLKLSSWAIASSQYFTCSGIEARVNVVALKELSYRETGHLATDLAVFNTGGEPPGADVAAFREANDADVVLVLVAQGDNYGLAEVFTTDYTVDQFKQIATGVAVAKVAFGHTLLHEVGHLMGGGHQRKHGTGRHSYSQGNVIRSQSGWLYTLMAHGSGSRLNLFSGPDVPLGAGSTGSATKDNARTLNETRGLVEGFQTSNRRPAPAVPCTGTLYPAPTIGAGDRIR